jgi:ABC-2 type transport system permease protein/lipopolysaccharide transport system permease protein
MAILVLGLGFVYGGLFGMPLAQYLPYLATGFIVWGLISICIIDACDAFYAEGAAIKQIQAPLSIYAYRVVWRTLIVFLHNMTIYAGVVAIFGLWPGLGNLVLACLGVILLCVNGVWASFFLGIIGSRFRDIPPIVASLVQVVFFLTPIFWHADQLPGRGAIVRFNPLFYYLEIVREPLLGNTPPFSYWSIALGLTVLAGILSLIAFTRYRRRIAYWV